MSGGHKCDSCVTTCPECVVDWPLGQQLYEREARNWPKPLGWDNLSEGSKAQWEERARCIKKLHEHTRSGHRNSDVQQGDPL
jgi:hypothetical protein